MYSTTCNYTQTVHRSIHSVIVNLGFFFVFCFFFSYVSWQAAWRKWLLSWRCQFLASSLSFPPSPDPKGSLGLERDKSTTEEAVPSLAMSVVGLSSAHPLSFLFERLQLVKQSLTWLSRKRKLCLRRKDLALLGFDAFVRDLCYNFLTMLLESSLFNFAMTSFEDERGKGGNRKHKNRCLVSKLTTCNIVAAFKYVSQVVITEKWALFFPIASEGMRLCWLEVCPVTVISHTDSGRQAILCNLAQM